MSQITSVPVSIHSRNFKEMPPTHGQISKVEYDKPERTKNALRTFGIFFGLAFASVFVPLVHYIAVPGFFITAFILGMDKMNEVYRNLGGEGECPKCHKPVKIEPSKFNPRMTDTCGSCYEDLEMFVEGQASSQLPG